MKKKFLVPKIVVREICTQNILAGSGEAQLGVEDKEITTSTTEITWN